MVKGILSAILFTLTASGSEPNLGQRLVIKNVDGKASFSAVYTYGSDPDGAQYLLTVTADLSPPQAGRSYRWNLYLGSSRTYVLNWGAVRTTLLTSAIQVKISDQYVERLGVISLLLSEQAKAGDEGQLYFVLGDENDSPIYYIPLSDLCRKYPSGFKDLTYGNPCNRPQL